MVCPRASEWGGMAAMIAMPCRPMSPLRITASSGRTLEGAIVRTTITPARLTASASYAPSPCSPMRTSAPLFQRKNPWPLRFSASPTTTPRSFSARAVMSTPMSTMVGCAADAVVTSPAAPAPVNPTPKPDAAATTTAEATVARARLFMPRFMVPPLPGLPTRPSPHCRTSPRTASRGTPASRPDASTVRWRRCGVCQAGFRWSSREMGRLVPLTRA